MSFVLYLIGGTFLLVAAHYLALALTRLGYIDYHYRQLTRASMGTALHELNAIARPSMYHTLNTIHARPGLQELEEEGDDPKQLTVILGQGRIDAH